MDIETQIKAAKALEFLREHPALNNDRGDSLFNGAWFHMELCCKNGKSQWAGSDGVTVWKRDPGWEKHKAYFDDCEDDLPEELQSAKVPYEEVYGEPWVADHMEYWWEVTFCAFESNPYDKKDAYTIDGKWFSYEGVSGGARSFEEMAINAADSVREVFGDFDSSKSFVTEAEEKNHNTVAPMGFKPLEDKPGYSECIFNDQYVDVYQGLMNLRWLKWFMGTDYAKKSWGHHVDHEWQTLVKKIEELEPESRKKLLAS